MSIRELLEIEKYIDETINAYSCKVKESDNAFQKGKAVIIPIETAAQIANCLDWLQNIVSNNINRITVEDFIIRQEFKKKYDLIDRT